MAQITWKNRFKLFHGSGSLKFLRLRDGLAEFPDQIPAVGYKAFGLGDSFRGIGEDIGKLSAMIAGEADEFFEEPRLSPTAD